MTLSDHDQRVLAALDADIAATTGGRFLARARARFSAVSLSLITLGLTAVSFGGLAAGVGVDSRGAVIAAMLVLTAAPAPTVIADRYADRTHTEGRSFDGWIGVGGTSRKGAV